MDDLQVISYSTKKYVDASTLSRIRSHAQSAVQSRKAGRSVKPSDGADPKPIPGLSMSSGSSVFNASTGNVYRPAAAAAAKGRRRPKVVEKETSPPIARPLAQPKKPLLLPIFQTLSIAPSGAKFLRFDTNFAKIFDQYYKSYKWSQPRLELLSTSLSNPGLWHSLLAFLYQITAPDPARAMHHENETIDLIYHGLEQFKTLTPSVQSSLAVRLIWPILRLATIKAHQGDLDLAVSHLNALAIVWPAQAKLEACKFGDHLRFTIGVLLMFNFDQPYDVHPAIRYPYGRFDGSAFDDLAARGYNLPSLTPLASMTATCIDVRIIDALKALTAICTPRTPDESSARSGHTHDKAQSIEFVKVALRLADMPEMHSQKMLSGWSGQLSECLRLTALLFTFCFGRRKYNHPAAVVFAIRGARVRCSRDLLCRIAQASDIDESLSDIVLWMLIVCGSTSETPEDQKYYSTLIHHFAPSSLGMNYKGLEAWGRRLPWLTSSTNSPVEEFWDLVCGRPQKSPEPRLPRVSLCSGLLHEPASERVRI